MLNRTNAIISTKQLKKLRKGYMPELMTSRNSTKSRNNYRTITTADNNNSQRYEQENTNYTSGPTIKTDRISQYPP